MAFFRPDCVVNLSVRVSIALTQRRLLFARFPLFFFIYFQRTTVVIHITSGSNGLKRFEVLNVKRNVAYTNEDNR
jgi:hypothetical protein